MTDLPDRPENIDRTDGARESVGVSSGKRSEQPAAPTPEKKLRGSLNEAVGFLKRLPHAFHTLTAIHINPKTREKGLIETKSFPPGAWLAIHKWLEPRLGVANLYWSANPLGSPKDRKAAKADIATYVMAQVDVDAPAGEEQEAFIERMVGKIPSLRLEPSIVIDSGGGVQLFYIWQDPTELNGDPAAIAAAEALTRGIEQEVSAALGVEADATFNVDRIMRLPGSINVPDVKKIEKGRRPRVARVVHMSDLRYPRSAFTPATPAAASVPASAPSGLPGGAPSRAMKVDWSKVPADWPQGLDDLPADLPPKAKTILSLTSADLYVLNAAIKTAGFEGVKEFKSWSSVTQSLAASLKGHRHKLSAEQIAAIISSDKFPCNHHVSKLDSDKRKRAVERALERSFTPQTYKSEDGVTQVRYDKIKLTQTVDAAQAALVAAKDINLYQRRGDLVQTVRFDAPLHKEPDSRGRYPSGEEGIYHAPGAVIIHPISETRLLEHLSDACAFVEPGADGWERIPAPKDVGKHIFGRPDKWTFPVLASVAEAPTITEQRRLVQAPGYDPASGIFLDLNGVEFPHIQENPTREAALDALALLRIPLREFPFKDAEPANGKPTISESVILSGILSGIVRAGIKAIPLHAVNSTAPGSGKSLLVDIIAMIAQGRVASGLAVPFDEAEFEKRLVGMLVQGSSMINLDNLTVTLSSAFLNMVLSQEMVTSRILGRTGQPDLSTRALITATGNGLVITEDMTRRTILCTLDAGMERPETRKFEQKDLLGWVGANRPALVAAALTILLAHDRAGMPGAPDQRLGGFEGWSDWIRGAILWLDMPDPVGNAAKLITGDPARTALETLLVAIHESPKYGKGEPFTSGDLIRYQNECRQVKDAIEGIWAPPRQATAKALSQYLQRLDGRIVGGMSIVSKYSDRAGFSFSLRAAASEQPELDLEPAKQDVIPF